ncbi:Gfo/Idh/MocA family oxidoreductase [Priestia megaterium]|uniref:Gfo/Idh/MocA family protein n=1 Tax=Priestia megaterium TaxID=1404 RepID=UPI000BFA33E3|nr:Gfo/Idh/MocA family oxidoreductase [Priestia megaterium]PFT51475.1 dehydrogenase [Priestia megaterium]
MINVALLSKWHVHAIDYANQVKAIKDLSIKVIWDEDPQRGKEWADELHVSFEKDLEVILEDPTIDAVIVNTPTNLHTEVILAAIKHKKHVFTEKVLALTVKECKEIFNALDQSDVQLMVSLPRLTEDYYVFAQEVLNQGALGELTSIRCRLNHDGAVPSNELSNGWLPEHFFNLEQCGGGALIDLGAHPIYLTNRLAGEVEAVSARLKRTLGKEVDDNAVVMVEYKSGALGILETGFLSKGSPFQLELYGTQGTLLIEDNHIRLNSTYYKDNEWNEPQKLPDALPMPMQQWVNTIIHKEEPSITRNDVLNLTLINEAAALSNKESRRVLVSEVY